MFVSVEISRNGDSTVVLSGWTEKTKRRDQAFTEAQSLTVKLGGFSLFTFIKNV